MKVNIAFVFISTANGADECTHRIDDEDLARYLLLKDSKITYTNFGRRQQK